MSRVGPEWVGENPLNRNGRGLREEDRDIVLSHG